MSDEKLIDFTAERGKRIHDLHDKKLDEMRQAFEQANGRIEIETIKFVKSWLIEHIVRNDYLFRDFLARRKSSDADLPQ